MRSIQVQRTIPASPQAVWDVLADFPNISQWNSGVKTSHATGPIEGVGAMRHCDLAPLGSLEEVVSAWEERTKMTVEIEASKLPLKRGEVTFDLTSDDDTATTVVVTYNYTSKLPFLDPILGKTMDKQLASGFDGFLEDLDKAAISGANA